MVVDRGLEDIILVRARNRILLPIGGENHILVYIGSFIPDQLAVSAAHPRPNRGCPTCRYAINCRLNGGFISSRHISNRKIIGGTVCERVANCC